MSGDGSVFVERRLQLSVRLASRKDLELSPARVLVEGRQGAGSRWPDQVSLRDEASRPQPQALGGAGDKI